MYNPLSKTISSLRYALLFSGALCMSGAVYAQTQNLAVGTAVRADGTDGNGNAIKVLDNSKLPAGSHWSWQGPAGEEAIGDKNVITDVDGNGYADMNRLTRNVEEADGTYAVQGKYKGVIDYGVTRDAKWVTVATNSDVGTLDPSSAPPARSDLPNTTWGSAERQQSIANFLKDYSSETGYIDNKLYHEKQGDYVFASSAELYGSGEMNKAGGMFDQNRERGYDAGTNYREGGLMYMDKKGGGVIGQSGGLYLDEGGQYVMNSQGYIEQATPIAGSKSKNPDYHHDGTTAASVAYDDWNQYGLVGTGMDLIAYTTSFNTAGSDFNTLGGTFSVLGNFLDIYINGNKIDRSKMTLVESLSGSMYGENRGILGEYEFFLDLMGIDESFWNEDGFNDISFMVETVTAWDLGISGNTTYAAEQGFNYFSAPDLSYGFNPTPGGNNPPGGGNDPGEGAATPEPATLAVMGLGLAGLGLARSRRNRKA